jgi:hypothetical protein
MSKYRSKVDYLQIYSGDKQGYNIGLDGAMFIRKEATPRTFQVPRIGTQGSSLGDDTADTDISGGTDTTFKIAVDGGAVVTVVLVVTGLTTGLLIAAHMETKINAALLAAGQDARVWVQFVATDDHYEIYSQFTGTTSAAVVTDGTSNNVADDLKIGIANGGTEAAGTNDQDFLLYTTGGPTFTQPIESNTHRSGRFHSGIIKKKKVAEFDFQTFINMSGLAGASIDTAVKLLWESLLGKETVVASTHIEYTQDLPINYFSMVRVSTIFGEYYTGAYVKDCTVEFPGDAPATASWSGKAEKRLIAGLAQVNGAVVASADVIVNNDQEDRYDVGAPVMVVMADGRTIVAGADGSLTISSIDTVTHKLVMSATLSVDDNGFVVPWHPGAIQQTGRDNIYTDLEGSFKLHSGGSEIDVSSMTLSFTNEHNDLDGYFGRDANAGFVAGNRLTMNLSITFDLSNENFAEVVQSSGFAGFTPEIALGATSGRHLLIAATKWIPAVPAIEVPENGTTPVTLEGVLYPTAPGTKDPISVKFK